MKLRDQTMRQVATRWLAGRALLLTAAGLIAACAATEPDVGMAVEDFEQACFESDRARGKLVFADRNKAVYYCDLWKTHYVFEDGILVRIQQEVGDQEME